jgi:hypothetical protein
MTRAEKGRKESRREENGEGRREKERGEDRTGGGGEEEHGERGTKFLVKDVIYSILIPDGTQQQFSMVQLWPVRVPRPCDKKIGILEPVVSGLRVIDTFFP